MRLFTYCCPRCHLTREQDIPGTDLPPDTVTHEHDCPETELKRIWMQVSVNYGFRPAKHDYNDQWMFTNG